MHSKAIRISWGAVLTFALLATSLLASLAFAIPAKADQDPGGCTASGVGLSLSAFRSDGTTPIGGGLVAAGETIVYKAVLSHLGGTNCNFEGGTLSITTPDGAVNVVASPATPIVPLVTSGSPFTSVGVNYVVSYANSGGDGILDATSNYSGGTSHTPTAHSTVGANNGISVVMESRIIVDKVTNPTGSATEFDFTTDYGSPFILADATTPNNSGPLVLGTYDVSEAAEAGWDNTSINCVSSLGDPADTNGIDLNLGAGETITCTFNNEQDANIIIIKQTTPDGSGQLFDFTASYDGDGFALSDGQQNDSGDLNPGGYVVAETGETGWQLQSTLCDSTQESDASTPGNLSLQAGETITCTFNNVQQMGHIIVDKVTDPAGDTQSFSFVATGGAYANFALTDAAAPNDQTLVAGAYAVAETVPAGWDLTGSNCVSSIQDVETPAALELDAGETITCTFNNQKDSNIIVDKVTSPTGSAAIFDFTTSYGSPFTLTDTGTPNNSGDLAPGSTYDVTEGAEAGWTNTGINCVSSLGDPADTDGQDLDLDAGETITCTFTNTELAGRIIIEKQTGALATTTQFEFDSSWSTNFMLADNAQNNSGDLAAGTYSVAEINLPANWALTSAVCSDQSPIGAISLQPGEVVTCVFTNTYTPPASEYCSPGYWKQSQHFDSWVTYSPDQLFSSVFEGVTINWSAKGKPGPVANPTLLQVLEGNGGGITSLARAAVGALLNASAIDSNLSPADVIAIFNAANPGGDYEGAKSQYTFAENCPLN